VARIDLYCLTELLAILINAWPQDCASLQEWEVFAEALGKVCEVAEAHLGLAREAVFDELRAREREVE
jgi:hypothetical protein